MHRIANCWRNKAESQRLRCQSGNQIGRAPEICIEWLESGHPKNINLLVWSRGYGVNAYSASGPYWLIIDHLIALSDQGILGINESRPYSVTAPRSCSFLCSTEHLNRNCRPSSTPNHVLNLYRTAHSFCYSQGYTVTVSLRYGQHRVILLRSLDSQNPGTLLKRRRSRSELRATGPTSVPSFSYLIRYSSTTSIVSVYF